VFAVRLNVGHQFGAGYPANRRFRVGRVPVEATELRGYVDTDFNLSRTYVTSSVEYRYDFGFSTIATDTVIGIVFADLGYVADVPGFDPWGAPLFASIGAGVQINLGFGGVSLPALAVRLRLLGAAPGRGLRVPGRARCSEGRGPGRRRPGQTLNRKWMTSPSTTTYSLPSVRSHPLARAPAGRPTRSVARSETTSARMKPRSKSEWMTPAAWGALVPRVTSRRAPPSRWRSGRSRGRAPRSPWRSAAPGRAAPGPGPPGTRSPPRRRAPRAPARSSPRRRPPAPSAAARLRTAST
jgi:hypothetical protein